MWINQKCYCDSCLETIAEDACALVWFQEFDCSPAEDRQVCLNCGQFASELEELGFTPVNEFEEGETFD